MELTQIKSRFNGLSWAFGENRDRQVNRYIYNPKVEKYKLVIYPYFHGSKLDKFNDLTYGRVYTDWSHPMFSLSLK